jgi:tyrosine-protein phosphatase SIW14
MTGMTPPTEAQIKQILALMEDQTAGPVFVHCKRGADRTGAVIAAYRIDHDKWENSKALSEAMTDKMSHFQFQRQQYIREFQPMLVPTTPVDTAAVATVPAVKN